MNPVDVSRIGETNREGHDMADQAHKRQDPVQRKELPGAPRQPQEVKSQTADKARQVFHDFAAI